MKLNVCTIAWKSKDLLTIRPTARGSEIGLRVKFNYYIVYYPSQLRVRKCIIIVVVSTVITAGRTEGRIRAYKSAPFYIKFIT